MTDPMAKREVERVPIAGQVRGEVTVFQPMTILNMSEKGMQIEASSALHNDSLHDFRLSLDDRSVIVKGRIVYCQIGELKEGVILYRCGIEFVQTSTHAQTAISDFVTAHKDAATAPPKVVDAEIAGEP